VTREDPHFLADSEDKRILVCLLIRDLTSI
jgi:hypothetical protein